MLLNDITNNISDQKKCMFSLKDHGDIVEEQRVIHPIYFILKTNQVSCTSVAKAENEIFQMSASSCQSEASGT